MRKIALFRGQQLIFELQNIDTLWLSLCVALVFFMQGGFLLLETGLVRSKNSINVAIKNIFDLSVSVGTFWLFGFGLMFGASIYGLVGKGHFLFQTDAGSAIVFFLFQSMFCATSVTIISGAIAERIYFHSYTYITIVISSLIYPVFGHWVWGGALGGAKGWLEQLGFIDFAGSTVVHSVGGWAALALLLIVGPREGRFSKEGKALELGASHIPLSVLGGLILWLGWFGFNGGSGYKFDGGTMQVLATTNMAAIFGIIFALLTSRYLFSRTDPRDLTTGALAGLVAITACAHCVSLRSSVIIGALAGVLAILSKALLESRKIDDAVDAVPVHLSAGIWGTLCVALFGEKELIGTGLSFQEQLSVQGIGILAGALWAFVLPLCIFFLINRFLRFRVSLREETQGLNISEHKVSTELYDFYRVLDQDILKKEEAPKISYTEIGKLAKTYKERLERDLRERTRALKNFLFLAKQGFFSFESNMKIELGYSQECQNILSQSSLEGKNPAELLFPPGIKREDFQGSFQLYFQGKIKIDTLSKLMDRRLVIHDAFGNTKDISAEYQEIENKRIMCILTDESEQKELKTLLSSEREKQDRLLKAVSNGKYFKHLLLETRELFSLFKELREIKNIQKTDIDALKSLFLSAHNLKANLSFFEFDKTTPLAFELESFLASLEESSNMEQFKKLSRKLENSFAEELKFFKEKLGEEWIESFGSVSIPTAKAIEIAEKLKQKHPEDRELIEEIEGIRKVSAKDIFHRLPELAEELAPKLGKKINKVSIEGGEIKLLADTFEPLLKTLPHIIRNMLDHGIETPEERFNKGKEETGNIQIKIKEFRENGEDYYMIQFSDDGRGIDFEKVEQIAYEKGFLPQGEGHSKEQLLKLLFSPQISTAEKVSDISGRGIGLASVEKEVRALRGRIGVQSKTDLGTTFSIRIKNT